MMYFQKFEFWSSLCYGAFEANYDIGKWAELTLIDTKKLYASLRTLYNQKKAITNLFVSRQNIGIRNQDYKWHQTILKTWKAILFKTDLDICKAMFESESC